jgi:hypothetical protein
LGEIHWHEPMSALIHNPIRYCKDGSPGYHFQSYNECTATSEWKVWPLTGTVRWSRWRTSDQLTF